MKLYSLIIIVFIFILSCSKLILVREPEMRVLGGKTLIEAQVLGRYRQIDESAYQISTLSSEKRFKSYYGKHKYFRGDCHRL